jgi:LysR family transcriptional activator of glutamate synthase operon
MNLNQLYYFRTLAKVMNFRRTSEQLHIAQPTLSVSIANLENELGVALFVRQGRYVELTKCGREYLERLDPILDELDNLTAYMKRMSDRSRGHVDIGYISPLAKNFIPENVRAFLKEPDYSQVTFQFHEDSTGALISGLKARKHDVIFCPFVQDEPDILFTPILEQEIVAVVPWSHPLAREESLSLHQLAGSPFVAYRTQSGLRRQIDHLLEQNGVVPDIVCDASDEDGIAALVENEFGVSCVARVSSLEYRKISILELKEPNCTRTIYMAYLRSGELPASVQDFIRFILEHRHPTSDTRLADTTK